MRRKLRDKHNMQSLHQSVGNSDEDSTEEPQLASTTTPTKLPRISSFPLLKTATRPKSKVKKTTLQDTLNKLLFTAASGFMPETKEKRPPEKIAIDAKFLAVIFNQHDAVNLAKTIQQYANDLNQLQLNSRVLRFKSSIISKIKRDIPETKKGDELYSAWFEREAQQLQELNIQLAEDKKSRPPRISEKPEKEEKEEKEEKKKKDNPSTIDNFTIFESLLKAQITLREAIKGKTITQSLKLLEPDERDNDHVSYFKKKIAQLLTTTRDFILSQTTAKESMSILTEKSSRSISESATAEKELLMTHPSTLLTESALDVTKTNFYEAIKPKALTTDSKENSKEFDIKLTTSMINDSIFADIGPALLNAAANLIDLDATPNPTINNPAIITAFLKEYQLLKKLIVNKSAFESIVEENNIRDATTISLVDERAIPLSDLDENVRRSEDQLRAFTPFIKSQLTSTQLRENKLTLAFDMKSAEQDTLVDIAILNDRPEVAITFLSTFYQIQPRTLDGSKPLEETDLISPHMRKRAIISIISHAVNSMIKQRQAHLKQLTILAMVRERFINLLHYVDVEINKSPTDSPRGRELAKNKSDLLKVIEDFCVSNPTKQKNKLVLNAKFKFTAKYRSYTTRQSKLDDIKSQLDNLNSDIDSVIKGHWSQKKMCDTLTSLKWPLSFMQPLHMQKDIHENPYSTCIDKINNAVVSGKTQNLQYYLQKMSTEDADKLLENPQLSPIKYVIDLEDNSKRHFLEAYERAKVIFNTFDPILSFIDDYHKSFASLGLGSKLQLLKAAVLKARNFIITDAYHFADNKLAEQQAQQKLTTLFDEIKPIMQTSSRLSRNFNTLFNQEKLKHKIFNNMKSVRDKIDFERIETEQLVDEKKSISLTKPFS